MSATYSFYILILFMTFLLIVTSFPNLLPLIILKMEIVLYRIETQVLVFFARMAIKTGMTLSSVLPPSLAYYPAILLDFISNALIERCQRIRLRTKERTERF